MLLLVLWLLFGDVSTPPQPPIEGRVDRIIVDKSSRIMILDQDDRPVRIYPIALGFAPDGAKAVEGDGRTPEGSFTIDRVNERSAFHLSLGIDYPQPRHVRAARARGLSPGGEIFIHGQPNLMPAGFKMRGDWTAGCIALTNSQVEELRAHAGIGTVVSIRP
jgi:murein L,D-transpeptidase YafK